MVSGINLKNEEVIQFNDFYEPWVAGKQSKLPFSTRRETRSSRPLELIPTDIYGTITPTTWDSQRYFITLIDDYTHFFLSCI